MQKMKYNWLPDFVYGGIDGAVTTFAIVAGVVGANLSTPVILILGFANLFADGFSMASGKFSSDRSELQRIDRIREIEKQAIKENPEEEKREIQTILKSFGFKGEDLDRAQKVIVSHPKVWVKIMLTHEFHVIEENIRPLRGALATFLAFVSIGCIPLLAYLAQVLFQLKEQYLFLTASIATLFALFTVGLVKAQFSSQNKILAGIETASIGGSAAAISYLVGHLLGKLFGVS